MFNLRKKVNLATFLTTEKERFLNFFVSFVLPWDVWTSIMSVCIVLIIWFLEVLHEIDPKSDHLILQNFSINLQNENHIKYVEGVPKISRLK